MLDRAHRIFSEASIDDVVRIDVPGRGASVASDDVSNVRGEVEPMIPAFQSGSLFGDRTGVLVVDAQSLLKAEAVIAADLVAAADPTAVVAVFVAAGSIPAPLAGALKDRAEKMTVKKMRERDAAGWLNEAARSRGVKIHGDAAAALVQRFGSDVAALGQALEQLAGAGVTEVTEAEILARFQNRPDEPMWHYTDAIAAGDVGAALRRLADFLTHNHPLVLLSFLENELRRRSLAAAAPDIETYASWVGGKPDAYPVQKAWRQRTRASDTELRRALQAVARADLTMKTEPEPTHRVTLERLTVALCRWLGGRATVG